MILRIGDAVAVGNCFGVVVCIVPHLDRVVVLLQNGRWAHVTLEQAAYGLQHITTFEVLS
jgi:hypothetical protein